MTFSLVTFSFETSCIEMNECENSELNNCEEFKTCKDLLSSQVVGELGYICEKPTTSTTTSTSMTTTTVVSPILAPR